MTLSQAIRAGAKIRPQAFGFWWEFGLEGRGVVGTCAIGAAYEVTFGVPQSPRGIPLPEWEEFVKRYPELDEGFIVKCPIDNCDIALNSEVLSVIIGHLNDKHRWTREAIADFVEMPEVELKVAA